MTSRPDTPTRRDRGPRAARRWVLPVAGSVALAAIGVLLAVRAVSGDDADRALDPAPPASSGRLPAADDASSAAGTEPGTGPLPFKRFPLDRGWPYDRSAINGPGPGAGGISMPEGHCDDEVLFRSGYQDKLSTYVATEDLSLTREILGYADADAARSTFGDLRDAVADCPAVEDPQSGTVVSSAEVYAAIDETNARAGTTTFTFAYTSAGAEPFGVLYQFALVDDVLYGSNEYGAWSARTAADGVAALDEANAPLTPLLSRIER